MTKPRNLHQFWSSSHYMPIHSHVLTHNVCLAELRDNSGTVPLAVSLSFNCFLFFILLFFCDLFFFLTSYMHYQLKCIFYIFVWTVLEQVMIIYIKKKNVLFAYFRTNHLCFIICRIVILGAKAWPAFKMMITMLLICFLLSENTVLLWQPRPN